MGIWKLSLQVQLLIVIEIIACIIVSLLLFGEFGGFGEIPDINEQNIKGHQKTWNVN